MTGARVFVAVLFLMLGASFIASTGCLGSRVPGSRLGGHGRRPQPPLLLLSGVRHPGARRLLSARRHFHRPLLAPPALRQAALPAWRHRRRRALDVPGQVARYRAARPLGDIARRACRRSGRAARLRRIERRVSASADRFGTGGSAQGGAKPPRPLQVRAQLPGRPDARSSRTRWTRSATASPPAPSSRERPAARRKGCFATRSRRLQADPAQRSLSATYDRVFLPLKVFFILIVVLIAALLAKWRDRIDEHYRELVPTDRARRHHRRLRHAVLAHHGLRLPADRQRAVRALSSGAQLRYSLVIVPWALLLLFYFLRRLGKQGEMIGQIAGVVTAAVAVLRYEDLNDWAVRLLGIGTNMWIVGVLVALAVVGLRWRSSGPSAACRAPSARRPHRADAARPNSRRACAPRRRADRQPPCRLRLAVEVGQ